MKQPAASFFLPARLAAWRPVLASGVFAAGVIGVLTIFLLLPVVMVVMTSLGMGRTGFSTGYLHAFFDQPLYRDAFLNSLRVSLASVAGASLIALPLAWAATRLHVRAGRVLQVLGILPLIMPPFVAAFALQPLLGSSGTLNLLLQRWWGVSLPLMEGTHGVILVESLHYFPFILLNLVASLRRVDLAMQESALMLGGPSRRLFWRIIVPLALPGYLAGAAIVFIRAFEDLGAPLVLGVTNLLAPLAYLRVATNGIDDALGNVIALVMLCFSAITWWCIVHLFRDRTRAYMPYLHKTDAALLPGRAGGARTWPMLAWAGLIGLVILLPYAGVLALALADIWSFSLLPDSWTLRHFGALAGDSGSSLLNTVLYCGIAGLIDVLLAVVIAHVVMRSRLPGRRMLELLAGAALAVPGVVLALGYLNLSREFPALLATASPFANAGGMIMAYAMQQLPYALMACLVAMRAVDPALEEVALSLGSTRWRALRRIRLPLIASGLTLGWIISFMASATDLSIAMLLGNAEEQAPVSHEIYLYMQSVSGRGPGAALAVVAVVVLGLLTAGVFALLQQLRKSAATP